MRAEQAAAALEVMSRFAAEPHSWHVAIADRLVDNDPELFEPETQAFAGHGRCDGMPPATRRLSGVRLIRLARYPCNGVGGDEY